MEANAKWLCEEFVTYTEEETEAVGESWAIARRARAEGQGRPQAQAQLGRPGCVLLEGPLGAGKTAWVRGFARGWGCTTEVSSPTFALVQEYVGGVWPVYHLDFYRLQREEEVWGLGFEDLLATGWVLVEWATRFPGVFPADAWWGRFASMERARKICLGRWQPGLLEAARK
jgi:tRNA threonylcarbamoyladenosine biosynthesis protein TsaE